MQVCSATLHCTTLQCLQAVHKFAASAAPGPSSLCRESSADGPGSGPSQTGPRPHLSLSCRRRRWSWCPAPRCLACIRVTPAPKLRTRLFGTRARAGRLFQVSKTVVAGDTSSCFCCLCRLCAMLRQPRPLGLHSRSVTSGGTFYPGH